MAQRGVLTMTWEMRKTSTGGIHADERRAPGPSPFACALRGAGFSRRSTFEPREPAKRPRLVGSDVRRNKTMSHTPLFRHLRQAASVAAESSHRSVDPERVLEERALAYSRRRFIRQAGIAAAALAGAPLLRAKKPAAPQASVAIIGAGLAGLTCAYRLKQAGIDATVYEANTRIGGRCWTNRGTFAAGQIAEHGGELIDQHHKEIRQLAQELRLPLDNVLAAEPNGTEATFFLNGEHYPYREATRDLKAIWQTLHRDLTAAGYPTLYRQFTAHAFELDHMSIVDWLEANVPGGRSSRLGELLDIAYTIEYGAECEQQSALNLLYLLGYNTPGQFTLFGSSNEKYHVRGGNDRIVSTLAYVLDAQIRTGMALTSATRTPGGRYALTFAGGSSVTVDKVVFALPFSMMKAGAPVDISGAGFSALKTLAIEELAMGSNSKLNVQFTDRHWTSRPLRNNGDSFADTGYQATWEVSRAQPGKEGILVAYSGGNHADTFGVGTPVERAVEFLGQIEPVLPGISTKFNGRATVDFWRGNPLVRGSYAFWGVGQYTRFAGVEGAQEGNAHFCGEHTSIDSQGYLNGAVETGERAAREVLSDLRG
jgi:monoamine oxidase